VTLGRGKDEPHEMALDLDETEHDGHAVVVVRGEVDLATSPQLRETLAVLVERSRSVVVDLDQVGFIDSTGIGVLVGGVKRARSHGGDLSLVCTQRRILKVLEITGLTQVFSVFESVDAATGR
jgi:anti-sigma B factor antagonist